MGQGSRPENASYFEKGQRKTHALTTSTNLTSNKFASEQSPMLKSPNSREDASKNSANLLNIALIESSGLNLEDAVVEQLQQSNKSHSHKLADPTNHFSDSVGTKNSKKTLDRESFASETMLTREGEEQPQKT